MSSHHVDARFITPKFWLAKPFGLPPGSTSRDRPDLGRVRAFHRCSTSEGSIAVCLTAGIDFPEQGRCA